VPHHPVYRALGTPRHTRSKRSPSGSSDQLADQANLEKTVDRVLTKNNNFDPKWPETHFLSGGHGWTRIDPVGSVLTKMTVFTRNDLKTHFLPWSTWFNPY
jgi:hypothetical protein